MFHKQIKYSIITYKRGAFIVKIEKIYENKVKVTLFSEDLKMYNITKQNIKSNSPQLHSLMSEVMRRVRTQTNFNPYGGQVVVEATPFDDGIQMIVSKPAKKVRVRAVKKSKKECVMQGIVCEFESFNNFLEMIKTCPDILKKDDALYKLNKKYYLLRCPRYKDERLKEYSYVYSSLDEDASFIKEHGCLVAGKEKLINILNYIISW